MDIADDGSEQDTIDVVGSRIDTPASLVESPPDPQAPLPVDTLDLLDRVPDVRAVSTAGIGGTSFVSIRGGEPNFAQVLIDGVRVSNPSNTAGGGFDFAQLDPAIVADITVVPTSRSAIYGSDALSGVIAVQLLSPEPDETAIGGRIYGDTASGYGGMLRGSAGWGGGGLLLAAGASDSGDLTPGSSAERSQFLGRIEQAIGTVDLSAFALYGETDRIGFPESSGGPLFATNRALETRDTRFLATGASIAGSAAQPVRPRLTFGYYEDRVELDTPAIYPGVFAPVPALTSDTRFDRFETTFDVLFDVAPAFDLVLGAGYLTEEAMSEGTIDFGFLVPTGFDIARDQLSAFAEAEVRPFMGLTLSGAVRRDWFDGATPAETTFQASIEYSLSDSGITAFGGFAEGFHRPSLFALAFPLTANPDLRPERSKAYEAGLVWERSQTQLRAVLFRTDYTDLIDFDPELFTTVNRSEVRVQGVTASGQGAIGRAVEWYFSASHIDTASEVPLRGRPDLYGNAGLHWTPTAPLTLSVDASFNDDVLESSIPTGVIELDGHVALSLGARWEFSDALSLTVALRNALDGDWQDAVGFPAPGRTLRAAIGFDF